MRLRAGHGGGRDEPFEKPWLSWPRREQQFTGHGACGVAQEQHDGDDVVEGGDDGGLLSNGAKTAGDATSNAG